MSRQRPTLGGARRWDGSNQEMGWESGTKACGEGENPNGAAGESGSQEKASFLLWQKKGETSQKTGCSRPRAPAGLRVRGDLVSCRFHSGTWFPGTLGRNLTFRGQYFPTA